MNIDSYHLFANYPLLTHASEDIISSFLEYDQSTINDALNSLSVALQEFQVNFPKFTLEEDYFALDRNINFLTPMLLSGEAHLSKFNLNMKLSLGISLNINSKIISIFPKMTVGQKETTFDNHQQIKDHVNHLIKESIEQHKRLLNIINSMMGKSTDD